MTEEIFAYINFESPTTRAAAAAVVGLTLIYYLVQKSFDMIEIICNRTYIYNICWEDPAVDHQILKIKPDDVIFRICSAGDIVLDYAIEGPSKIVICDMNQHQLYLFELKIRMLRDPLLTHREWWGIWGSSDSEIAVRVWKRMRHTMSTQARQWWDPRLEKTFRKGFAHSGSSGLAAKFIVSLFMYVVGFDLKGWAETGFSHEYISKNSYMIKRAAWWIRCLFPRIIAPFAGVPTSQIGPEFYTLEFYEEMLREIFLDPDFGSSNYFYRFYYDKGYKDQSCCPRTLKKKHFKALKANAGCFEWHHATVQETMERVQPHSFTKLILLDHMDWMPNSIVADEWVALQRASKPGAQILWRSAFKKMDGKPFFNNLDIEDLSPAWYSKDRVKTYPGTFMSFMPKDPLPWVDPVPSPCQRVSVARKFSTTTKMILHPLTAGKINAHGEKMSSFYAKQAIGYDAVRENMLISRPEMMSGFGPIKEGHTWLDIGGGTGRNIHYLRAQLDLFERIIVLDICPELLAIGEQNAKLSFTPSQIERIRWVCLDINSSDVRAFLAPHLRNNIKRGFDAITFSYSLTMIPKWEQALESAKSLLSDEGRVLLADFDCYTDSGNSFKDFIIRQWYKQDGVRIEAKTRDFVTKNMFTNQEYSVTVARFRKKLFGVNIPHMVICCRKPMVTSDKGVRKLNHSDLTQIEEKKYD